MLKASGSDLSSILGNPTPVLAVFYTDWCPYCRSFLQEFERIKSDRFQTALVDISDWDNPLWEEYNIDVVPTLIAFKAGKEAARRNGRSGIGLKTQDIEELRRNLE